MEVCIVCACEMLDKNCSTIKVENLPHPYQLKPAVVHPGQLLHGDLLLYKSAIDASGSTHICTECHKKLKQDSVPPLSLVNNMWIREILLVLSVLTLPKRVLVAKYFPAAYIVKLYLKKKGSQYWDPKLLNSALKGNVSTYRLDPSRISNMIDGKHMPPPVKILAVTIRITFVGP